MPVVYSFLFKFRNRAFSHLTCSWLQKGLQLFIYVAEVPKDTQHGWQLPGGLAPLRLQLTTQSFLEATLFQQIFCSGSTLIWEFLCKYTSQPGTFLDFIIRKRGQSSFTFLIAFQQLIYLLSMHELVQMECKFFNLPHKI